MITTVFIRECPVLGTRQSYSTGGLSKSYQPRQEKPQGSKCLPAFVKFFLAFAEQLSGLQRGSLHLVTDSCKVSPGGWLQKLLKSELSSFISHQVIAIQFLEGNLFFPFFSMT